MEVSLVGCQIQHRDRITPKAHLPLRFKWRGQPVKLDATVMRSEMRSIDKKPTYISGLSFCASPDDSPKIIREIVGWLANEAKSTAGEAEPIPQSPAPPPVEPDESTEGLPLVPEEDEAEVLSAPYLQCTLRGGTWDKIYVYEPVQPAEGFTILAPSDDAEVTVLCRAYQAANAAKRGEMRARFERAIAQSLRGR